jgi:hypothetical protein
VTLIELLWFTFWLGGGIAVGYRVGHAPGAVLGFLVGFGAMWLAWRVIDPRPNDWPACACGEREASAFTLAPDRKEVDAKEE